MNLQHDVIMKNNIDPNNGTISSAYNSVSSSIVNPSEPIIQGSDIPNNYSTWELPLDIKRFAGKFGLTGSGIRIGFVDTGINISHDVFKRFGGSIPYFEINSDELNLSSDLVRPPYDIPHDTMGHGTHVASIASGLSERFQGVAYGADILMVNIFGNKENWDVSAQDLLDAFKLLEYYRQVNGNDSVRILSLSIGAFYRGDEDLLVDYLEKLTDEGMYPVCAAGNFGFLGNGSIISPAISQYSLSVGGFDDGSWVVPEFSAQGPSQLGGHKPELVAPSVNVWGADYSDTNGYRQLSGTSQAVPYVSGILALLLEFFQKTGLRMSWNEIKWLFMMGALNFRGKDGLRAIGYDTRSGWGLVQFSPMADFLIRNHSHSTWMGEDGGNYNYNIELGGESGNVILIPIKLRAYRNYRISLSQGYAQIGLFSGIPGVNGEPVILYDSGYPADDLLFYVNETGNYILTLRVPYASTSCEYVLSLGYLHLTPYFFYVIFLIVGGIAVLALTTNGIGRPSEK